VAALADALQLLRRWRELRLLASMVITVRLSVTLISEGAA
jgi:hypothetical protein